MYLCTYVGIYMHVCVYVWMHVPVCVCIYVSSRWLYVRGLITRDYDYVNIVRIT